MPIDLKWIRNNPDLVRNWQKQRGLSTENVDRVLDLDHRCRALLKHLEKQRSELKKLQKSMRPSVADETDSDSKKKKKKSREEILQERKLIDESIRQTEKEWKAASKETLQALWCIASPVDEQVSNSLIEKGEEFVTTDPNQSCGGSVGIHHRHNNIRKKLPEFDFTKGPGFDLAQAILSMARRRFAKYPIYKFPTKVFVVSKNITASHDDESSVESDHALAMCGCIEAAADCCDNLYNQPSTIPGWLGMVTHRFPPKSIFGAKQLPRFVSIWGHNTTTADSTDTFEIIAMTAGTVWDSRCVQSILLEELEIFYRDLLLLQSLDGNNTAATTRLSLPANQLEMHELSRIILRTRPTTAGDGDGGRPLGYVSNFGDSVSRANEIQFLGGGLQKKGKEYVHFVRAVVLTPSIMASVMDKYFRRCLENS